MMDNELLNAIENLLDKKLDEKLQPIKADITGMKADIAETKADITGMKADIAETKIRLEKVESDTNSLRAGQLMTRKDLQVIRKDLQEVKDLAYDAWGQSTENRVLLNNL